MVNKIRQDVRNKMDKSIDVLKNALTKIRTGRAHPSLLDQIQVQYYDSLVPLSQVCNITTEDAKTLKVNPWEKEMIKPIEKAILQSRLGLNPNSIDNTIHITLPALTENRRKELVRIIKENGEKSRIAIRHIRRDANNDFKNLLKEKKISKDILRDNESDIQKLTDNYIKRIDNILIEKEDILLGV